jgi:hypothetical protein
MRSELPIFPFRRVAAEEKEEIVFFLWGGSQKISFHPGMPGGRAVPWKQSVISQSRNGDRSRCEQPDVFHSRRAGIDAILQKLTADR